MELYIYETVSALPTVVCAPAATQGTTMPSQPQSARPAGPGYALARVAAAVAPAAPVLMDRERVQVPGTSGFVAQHNVKTLKPIGGVRGIPPRGRPV